MQHFEHKARACGQLPELNRGAMKIVDVQTQTFRYRTTIVRDYVHVSQQAGLGQEINFDYIREHLVDA
jgi:hypothetical protein